jgi:hypothetical protein
MEDCWKHDNPVSKFMRKLRHQRARSLMRDKEYLRRIRFKHVIAASDQKRFGEIWADYGTNVYMLIAEATKDWSPSEDEQKSAAYIPPPKKEVAVNLKGDQNDDNLVATCEKGTRERFDQLQGKLETGLCELEEAEGKGVCKARACEKGKEEARSGCCRGEEFSRTGGGT